MAADNVLDINGLSTHFVTDAGTVRAVDGIDLAVPRGSTVCLVGESGSGKSATARSIMQLVDAPGQIVDGEIRYTADEGGETIDIATLPPKSARMRRIRGKQISMVFQEPMSSLSPVHTVGEQIAELWRLHEGMDRKAAMRRVVEELDLVGIPRPEQSARSYTFQLSGGMRQRAMIAMALICRPGLVIADEPTTAIDVTTQAQVLDLLDDLKSRLGMSMLFITHDLGVVAEIADEVAVMRAGHIVERGPVDQIFHDPQHDYTRRLLDALPQRRGSWLVGGEEPAAPTAEVANEAPVLELSGLRMRFGTRRLLSRRDSVVAVDDVSLQISEGETLGLVGESGPGKTSLGRCVLRAYRPTEGRIVYRPSAGREVDLATLGERELKPYRHQIRMVFQDPYGSLNPRMTVGNIVGQPLRTSGVEGSEARDRIADMLSRVGLRPDHMRRYPHAFSGGERQRIGIARALVTHPRLVVADEAVSSLDVSVRAQVLELLAELQRELGLTYLFISHDLSVIESICDRVAVMHLGKIVEQGDSRSVFTQPQHDYTKALLSAVPLPDPRLRGTRERVTYGGP